jgi:hypothetical protein
VIDGVRNALVELRIRLMADFEKIGWENFILISNLNHYLFIELTQLLGFCEQK